MRLLLTLALLASFASFATPNNTNSLYFTENKGQVKDQFYNSRNDIQFSVPGNGMTLFIGNGQLHYQFTKPIGEMKHAPLNKTPQPISWDTYRLDMELINANQHAEVITEEKQDYYENHFLPNNYNTLVAYTYKKITYKNIYSHIDWVLYIKGDKLKHEFIVNEGGNPADIKMKYSGATALSINNDGGFFASTPLGTINEAAPYSYQSDSKKISSHFKLQNNILSFEIGHYSNTLVIDPVINWINTIVGNDETDQTRGIASSPGGSVYACGITTSTANFATVGAHQYTYGGNDDGYITKINGAGVTQWTTYYGGAYQDYLYSITYDENSGHIYSAGNAFSNTNIGTPGTQEPTSGINTDGFIVKFDTNGTRIWGTYVNGTTYIQFEGCRSITHDEQGNIYVAGITGSSNMATPGTHQTTNGGGVHDILVSKYNSAGFRIWSTYFGGSDKESSPVVAYNDGKLYLSGTTLSTNGIAFNNPFQSAKSADEDAFVAKFDTTGTLVWSTYYGQNALDDARSIAVSDNNDIYISGTTLSTLMSTPGAHQETPGAWEEGFIAKFSNGGNLIWGTYYGGYGSEYLQGISYDNNSQSLYISGITQSSNNIATPGTYQPTLTSSQSGFMAKFTSSGQRLWGSYISNNNVNTQSLCIENGPGNVIYVGGWTYGINLTKATVHKFYDCQKPVLTGSITGNDTVCTYSSQLYSAPTALVYDSYNWILPNTWTGSSNTNQINTIAGTVSDSIYFYATNTCGSSDTISKLVLVNDPEATITISGLDLSTTTTFNTYQWYYNGTLITNAINQIHTIGQDGDYYVIVTDAFGCSDTSNTITYTTVSVNDPGKSLNIAKIYPNPATNELTIEGSIKRATILISDGKKIARYHNFDKQTIDISSFAQGVYFVELETEEGKRTLKFTKE